MNTPLNLSNHYDQLLGLRFPWKVEKINVDTDKLKLTINIIWTPGEKAPCPECKVLCGLEDHREERTWRHLDTMQFETLLKCRIPRVNCSAHGKHSITVPWAGEHSRFTSLFEHFSVDVILAAKSIKQAKSLLRLSWDQIHHIQERAVERGLSRRAKEPIKHAGVDEKNFLKGHSYVSLLTNLDKGSVLEVVPDRTLEAAKTLMNTLSDEQKQSLEAMAMDMWDSFMTAAADVVPNADIVHDKYHAVSYVTKAVDKVRRKENRQLTQNGSDTLKGTKFLWLTNPDNWNPEDKKAFRSFAIDELKVGRAWSIKEAFAHFWNYSYRGSAESFFKRWYFWATHSKLKPIIETAKTLKRHLTGLLAYLKHHITNAVTEGLNSKIQSLKANARGFRSFANYRISILFHCGKLNLYP